MSPPSHFPPFSLNLCTAYNFCFFLPPPLTRSCQKTSEPTWQRSCLSPEQSLRSSASTPRRRGTPSPDCGHRMLKNAYTVYTQTQSILKHSNAHINSDAVFSCRCHCMNTNTNGRRWMQYLLKKIICTGLIGSVTHSLYCSLPFKDILVCVTHSYKYLGNTRFVFFLEYHIPSFV